MPVTFSPVQHPAHSRSDLKPITAPEILEKACPKQFKQVDQILQYSVGGRSGPDDTQFKIIPNENGFVNTVLSAYTGHYALILCPDDVWLTIVSQFSFYVNANAELLRANFVAHEGKKELEVFGTSPPDFGALSRQMADLIHKNVVDPGLREWIVPKFSTTTNNDRTVGCMLMMATMKKYFDYKMSIMCGIPRVTLEGERRDWELLLGRLEKLKEYGIETIAWYHLLVPIISQLVSAFDDPNSAANLEFWQKVAYQGYYGSGEEDWTGWITAFCIFSEEGRWCGPPLDKDHVEARAPESLSCQRFWASYLDPRMLERRRQRNILFGMDYPTVDSDYVPAGYAEVDVTFNNNGAISKCVIVAGLVGMGFSSSRDRALSSTGKNDTVRLVVGWWMYSKLDEAEQKRRREAKRTQQQSSSLLRTIIIPTPPSAPPIDKRDRKAKRQSLPAPPPPTQSTTRWVADQSRAAAQGASSAAVPQSRAVHARRNSEVVVVGATPAGDGWSRQNSLWKRVFKS
ncbi:hypothetical protein FB451DRAFT_1278344 [Mycena latifolia]|nr:hypothetical protein FB451DRAFT_1278344 [Mycena latifolia]